LQFTKLFVFITLRQSIDERLVDIDLCLQKMEGSAADGDEEGKDGGDGSEEIEEWTGCSSS